MPGRTIFNKCVYFVSTVRKIANKKDFTCEELNIKKMAALVASLSSNHSWRTYKYIFSYSDLDKNILTQEAAYAFKDGWKFINETDVEEVVNANINPHRFSMWLFYAIDECKRNEFNDLYNKLRTEFAYGLEPMEKMVD